MLDGLTGFVSPVWGLFLGGGFHEAAMVEVGRKRNDAAEVPYGSLSILGHGYSGPE